MLPLDQIDWLGLPAFAIGVPFFCLGASALGMLGMMQFKRWGGYSRDRIVLAPPAWVFPVVWTLLYILIGFSGFFFWRGIAKAAPAFSDKQNTYYTAGLFLYFGNLLFNIAWTPLFFGLRLPFAALIDVLIIVLSGAAYAVMAGFLGISGGESGTMAWIAFGLYVPYVLWSIFATFLNLQYAFHSHYEYTAGIRHGRSARRGVL